MSATVTYKGQTIGTVSNETKKIDTAGTWLEDDIVLVDSSGSVEDKFITVTFNNHLETGNVSLYNATSSPLVNGSSGYVEMTTISAISPGGTTTKLMPYGFGLAVRSAKMSSANIQNFELQMNNAVIDPTIEGKSGTTYYKLYRITKANLDSSNNVIDFYSILDPFKDTVLLDTLSATVNGTYTATSGTAYSEVVVNVPSGSPNLQSKTNIAPTTSSQTITADSGYDGLSSVQINAMPSGTAGTPTATKGSVSNHSVTVTPSVTNTAGYISGGTHSGTGVTVTASELASGNKEITQNGTNIDVVGYSTVSVNVPSSAIITDTTDTAGGTVRTITTTNEVHLQANKNVTPTSSAQVVLPDTGYDGFAQVTVGAGGSTPSATAHTIYFEFSDSTDETINAWYNSSFISDAITATTPTTYGQKTVDSASLDGVTWYTRPTETWETVYNISDKTPNQDTPYNYFWLSENDLGNVYPTADSVWRITIGNTEYRCTAISDGTVGYVCVGNPKYSNGTDNGSNAPFNFYNAGWGAWVGDTELATILYSIKIEHLVGS